MHMSENLEFGGRRIVYVVNHLPFLFSHREHLLREILRQGAEVTVIAPQSALQSRLSDLGIQFRAWRLSRTGMNPFSEIVSIIHLLLILHRERPDVLHLLTIKPVIYGALVGRLFRVSRVVAGITGRGQMFAGSGFAGAVRQWAITRLMRFALNTPRTRCVFQNSEDLKCFIEHQITDTAHCVLVQGAGVDFTKFFPTPEPEPPVRVVLAARLLWQKGIGEFVAAARLLAQRGVASEYLVYGESDPENPGSIPQSVIADWKREGPVRFCGVSSDIAAVLKSAHIACLPTYYNEGVPKFLLEAIVSGRAVVTTDWPGCRDVVKHGENGLLVKPRDVESLAKALAVLIDDKQLRQRLGAGMAKGNYDQYSVEHVAIETIRTYS